MLARYSRLREGNMLEFMIGVALLSISLAMLTVVVIELKGYYESR